MGTDIHGIFQAKKNGVWVDIPHKWEQDRHYFLFAWLAGVRNGFGFGGVETHTPLFPISEPRGIPADFAMVDDAHPTAYENFDPRRQSYYDEDDKSGFWMGDHSYSWLLADEILTAKPPLAVTRSGVVTIAQYQAWDGKSRPDSCSGGIWGPGIVTSDPKSIGPETTHVRIHWQQDSADELAYFVDEVRRLRDEHGDVRLVFGFDS